MPSTGIPIIDWFLAVLDQWGYIIVFGITIFENLMVIGSFTPGETLVIAGATVAANGGLLVAGVWIASFIGTVTGSNISYWVGRRLGMESVRATVEWVAATRIGRWLKITDSALDDVQQHFDDEGVKTVFLSRFAPGAKNMVPAVAGATRMPVFWFELYTVLGAITQTTTMVLVGWFLGNNIDRALQVASAIGYAGFIIFALFVGGFWFAGRRLRARREASAAEEAAEEAAQEAGLGDGTDPEQ